MKRIFLIVLDSFGIGAMPDSESFGDVGVNTLGACATSSALNIPNMIVGHDANSGMVELDIYSNFTSTVTEKERLSLASMDTSGCNRDGCALRLCADLLAKRPERIKLMIVISDGAPNDTGYKGFAAQEDIRTVVAEYRRKGLLIYGAAIDDDKEIIEKLYGQGFLSIQNLNNLPRTLIRLIQRHMT